MLAILHEDADLLVVNKPAGLVCHPSKDGEQSSLIGRVRLYLGTSEGRLVNRLDRETSGVVLIAKSAQVARELGRAFATDGAVQKVYDAVVHGRVHAAPGRSGEIRIVAPLGKDEASPVAVKDCVRDDGAVAVTDVRLVQAFTRPEGAFSILEVRPRTGRKHQIRIHLAHIGHPVVGDKLYGADEGIYLRFVTGRLTDEDRTALRLTNHALHAKTLGFPWRERAWRFEAERPDELRAFITSLEGATD